MRFWRRPDYSPSQLKIRCIIIPSDSDNTTLTISQAGRQHTQPDGPATRRITGRIHTNTDVVTVIGITDPQRRGHQLAVLGRDAPRERKTERTDRRAAPALSSFE